MTRADGPAARRRVFRGLRWWSAAALWVILAPSAPAGEPYRDFLRGLWANGYGEAALDYVNLIRQRPDLPAEVQTALDLYVARSLRIAAGESDTTEHANERLAAASANLDKFLKAHPDHPDIASAWTLAGEIELIRGEEALRSAQAAASSKDRARQLAGARELFEAARPQLAKAIAAYGVRYAELAEQERAEAAAHERTEAKKTSSGTSGKKPPRKPLPKWAADKVNAGQPEAAAEAPPKPKPPSERMVVEQQWLDARFKAALVEYDVSQTYTDVYDVDRTEALKAASAGFNAVHDDHPGDRIGLVSQLWSGKATEALGDTETALEIYDEVLALAPIEGELNVAPDVAEMIGQAECRRLALLETQGDREAAIQEAHDWLTQFHNQETASWNQGVMLELARLELAAAERSSGERRSHLTQSALEGLAKVARTPGKFQREAILLRKSHQDGSATASSGSFADVLALAKAAAGNALYADAIESYRQAIKLGREPADHREIMAARLELARILSAAGKPLEAFESAQALSRDPTALDVGPQAALLAVNLAWNLYVDAAASDKDVAEKRLRETAELVTERWPTSTEADEARMILARLRLMRNELSDSLTLLGAIRPTSERYRTALLLAAQVEWKLYLDESQKPDDKRNAKETAALRDKTIAGLRSLIDLETKSPSTSASGADGLRDAALMLAEVYLTSGDPAQAAAIVEPLLAKAKSTTGQPPDAGTLRATAFALRAYLALGQAAKADEVSAYLLEGAGDDRPVNTALVEMVRLLKKQQGDSPPPGSSKPAPASPQLILLLDKLRSRHNFSLSDEVYLGTVCRDLGRRTQAIAMFQAALAQAAKELTHPAPQTARVLTQVRLLLVDLLREEHRFADALPEADRLIQENPNSIEPLIKKAQILQGWSETKDDQLDAAVAQWKRVSAKLQSFAPRPPEYYEAVYNAADGLLKQAARSHDPTKTTEAEKQLKAALAWNPNLSGKEMVQRYQALLTKIHPGKPAAGS
jgi:tetratricopeptide (TPR) repeat protein